MCSLLQKVNNELCCIHPTNMSLCSSTNAPCTVDKSDSVQPHVLEPVTKFLYHGNVGSADGPVDRMFTCCVSRHHLKVIGVVSSARMSSIPRQAVQELTIILFRQQCFLEWEEQILKSLHLYLFFSYFGSQPVFLLSRWIVHGPQTQRQVHTQIKSCCLIKLLGFKQC